MRSVGAPTLAVLAALLLAAPSAAQVGGYSGIGAWSGGHARGSSYSGGRGVARYHYGGYGYSQGRHGYGHQQYGHSPGGHRPYGYVSGYLPSHSGARHYYAPYPYQGRRYRRGYRSRSYLYPRHHDHGYGVYGFTIPKSPPYGSRAKPEATLSERMVPGWALLAEGEAAEAVSVFAATSAAHPDAGGPKVGYAIAQAMTGDLPTGVWAMRRALAVDPVALHYLTLDDDLESRLRLVIDRYAANRLGTPSQRIDGAFMVAALSYLLQDTQSARGALADAHDLGDSADSTQNLLRLVNETGMTTDPAD